MSNPTVAAGVKTAITMKTRLQQLVDSMAKPSWVMAGAVVVSVLLLAISRSDSPATSATASGSSVLPLVAYLIGGAGIAYFFYKAFKGLQNFARSKTVGA